MPQAARHKKKKNELPPLIVREGEDYVTARRRWRPTRAQIIAALERSRRLPGESNEQYTLRLRQRLTDRLEKLKRKSSKQAH